MGFYREEIEEIWRKARMSQFPRTDDPMRHGYRVLSDQEKEQVAAIKDVGQEFFDYVKTLGTANSREMELARTKMEEAVMWAVKAVTAS
jgi:hypothetical protein